MQAIKKKWSFSKKITYWFLLLSLTAVVKCQNDTWWPRFVFLWFFFSDLFFITIIFNLLLNFLCTFDERSTPQGRGKVFFLSLFVVESPPASPSSFLPLFWLRCYAAFEFKQAQRGFIAKYRIFCFFWQVCLLSPRAPYVLFWLENYCSVYCEEELGCN